MDKACVVWFNIARIWFRSLRVPQSFVSLYLQRAKVCMGSRMFATARYMSKKERNIKFVQGVFLAIINEADG